METAVKFTSADAVSEEPPAEFTPERPHRSRRVLRRTLILAAVLILMMGLVVCTSEGVRLKLSSLFFGNAPGSTRVLDDSNLVVDLERVELGYVPEGFEVVSDEMIGDYCRMINGIDANGNIFVFSATKTKRYVYNADNERNNVEAILINDKEGYSFYDGVNNTVIWQVGDCTYQLTSNDEVDMLVEFAETIVIQ